MRWSKFGALRGKKLNKKTKVRRQSTLILLFVTTAMQALVNRPYGKFVHKEELSIFALKQIIDSLASHLTWSEKIQLWLSVI